MIAFLVNIVKPAELQAFLKGLSEGGFELFRCSEHTVKALRVGSRMFGIQGGHDPRSAAPMRLRVIALASCLPGMEG
jgi:hypothetical protein